MNTVTTLKRLGFILLLLLFFSLGRFCYGLDIERLADSIYLAEGGAKTSYPYGILTKYKTTTPHQACINTIKHALKDWDGKGDFIEFLGSRYCPVGAKNDPQGLNKNWVRNVKFYYERGNK